MCLCSESNGGVTSSPSCPSKLVPRKCPPMWQVMLWTPVECLLVSTTLCLGCAALAAPVQRLNLPHPGTVAATVQGVLVLLHAVCEGPRLQMIPSYVPALLLGINATGCLAGSTAWLITIGVMTLSLASLSLLLCYQLPKLLPVNGRGPFAVAIATEHIRTPLAADGNKEDEQRPLEVMAQVFYPLERSAVARLPWFPFGGRRFRRSLLPAWGSARLMPFGLTQAGVVGAGVIIASTASTSSVTDTAPSLDALLSLPVSTAVVDSAVAWGAFAAAAVCLTCLVSDLRLGASRSAYKARYLEREQSIRIGTFAKMPGWLAEHVSRFDGPGFDAGHFCGPDVPCFPVAPLARGERKRRLVIFSHGLGGNRAVYAAHAAEAASHGYVAVFLEHNDASGSSCMLPDGSVTGYAQPPNTKDFTAPENRVFRLAQLRRRARELRLTRGHLSNLVSGGETDFDGCRRVGLGGVLDVKRPAFVGHSFGGATVLQGLYDERSAGGDNKDGELDYSMAFLMDAWTFPMSDEALEQSVGIPVVFVTTDTFLGKDGAAREERLVDGACGMVRAGANDLALRVKVKAAEHTNFSDSALFSPRISRSLGMVGKMDPVTFIDQITRLELCALEVFLRRRTESGDADKTSPPSELSTVLLGSDLAEAFPEARVERVSAGGVLPATWIE